MRPDVVFTGGPGFSAGPGHMLDGSVAVHAGRIVAVGSRATEIARFASRVIDLDGRLLVPGFQDAHVHPIHGGLRRIRCDLTEIADRADALESMRRYAIETNEAWVSGGGWAFEWFNRGCPSADLLDELTGDKPAYLVVRDGHSAWVNHAALRRAGITASTPDPPDGRIERLADGSPQGTLHEGAMELVSSIVPAPPSADLRRALIVGRDLLFSSGVTAWQDAWVTPLWHAAYRALGAELGAEVRGAVWWDRSRGLGQLEDIFDIMGEGAGTYRPAAVKLMLDGVCENFTASMLDPYVGDHGRGECHRGNDFIEPAHLIEIVTTLHAVGIQCHFHAIGDAAVRHALDAVEEAVVRHGRTDLRHTIAHIQVIHPSDLRRFSSLGVVATCQPLWACNEPAMVELTIPFLGSERTTTQYPFGSLLRAGASLAMGSDWPVSGADVLAQLHVAVTRTPPDMSAEVFLPRERISLEEALTAFTLGSAHVNHLDVERGRLRVGNVADLVVLDGDPFENPDITGVGVELTMVSGQVVFERRS